MEIMPVISNSQDEIFNLVNSYCKGYVLNGNEHSFSWNGGEFFQGLGSMSGQFGQEITYDTWSLCARGDGMGDELWRAVRRDLKMDLEEVRRLFGSKLIVVWRKRPVFQNDVTSYDADSGETGIFSTFRMRLAFVKVIDGKAMKVSLKNHTREGESARCL